MWRGAVARRFVSSYLSLPRAAANPNPVSSFGDALASWRAAASPVASCIHSDPYPGVRTAIIFSLSSPAEAAVLGSLGFAVSRKGSDVTDAVRHYGRFFSTQFDSFLCLLIVATSGAGFVLGSSSVIDLTSLCCRICQFFKPGGLTSLWFTLESSLLTLCMSIGAVMFVLELTTENARRMFYGSLFYLSIFMAGLLLHRLPNDNQEIILVNSSNLQGLLISDLQEYYDECSSHQERRMKNANNFHGRAPVAYASVAPFPFLPAPLYVSPDS